MSILKAMIIAPLLLAALVENVACSSDPKQTYTLYLPSAYSTNAKWPVLLVLDPRGHGTKAAEIFKDAAEERGWIVMSSNNTASDTQEDVNDPAVRAMWSDLKKYSIDPKQIYAAGFSGTATAAWMLANNSHLIAGIITSGEPWIPEIDSTHAHVPIWAATGDTDFNNAEVRRIDRDVAQSGIPHHFEIFEGPHSWMPASLARDAIEWHTLLAMRNGLRPIDPAFVDRLYTSQMERAAAEEAAAHDLAAQRRYDSIERDFKGLHATTKHEPTKRAREQLRDEERADAYEEASIHRLIDTLTRILANPRQPISVLSKQMRLPQMKSDAMAADAQGFATRRVLERLSGQVAFYLPQKYFAAHEYEKAATVLSIAAELKPNQPNIQYNLARAEARAGHADDALAALDHAVKSGFTDAQRARNDADLASIHGPRFDAILGGAQ